MQTKDARNKIECKIKVNSGQTVAAKKQTRPDMKLTSLPTSSLCLLIKVLIFLSLFVGSIINPFAAGTSESPLPGPLPSAIMLLLMLFLSKLAPAPLKEFCGPAFELLDEGVGADDATNSCVASMNSCANTIPNSTFSRQSPSRVRTL